MQKKWTVLVSVLILMALGYVFIRSIIIYDPPRSQKTPTNITTPIKVTQVITAPSLVKNKQHIVTMQRGSTALDLLKKTVDVQIKDEATNAFILSINGRKADDAKKEFWAFYVNGKQAEVGAGSYVLKNNDKIEWKIENY